MTNRAASAGTGNRRKRVAFALAALLLALAATAGTLLAVDIFLHSKYQTSAGFNVWGYRGPVVGRKKAGEYRVVVLGGSSAYGYGVTWDQSMPALLEGDLAKVAPKGMSFRVVNLGYNNEGAFSFTFTMKDYDYLRYDLVCLYEGYNDLMPDLKRPNMSVFRHDSPVFRMTGYLPIFPIVFKEKAAAMLTGDPGGLYLASGKTVFRPGLAARAVATMISVTGEAGEALERQLGRVTAEPPRQVAPIATSLCSSPWGQYCRSIVDAIELALSQHRQVLFVTQPWLGLDKISRARHMDQQSKAVAMVKGRFGGDPRVMAVSLGDEVDLADPALSFDHMHLRERGNALVAARLVQPVIEMASRRGADKATRPAGTAGTE